MVYQSNDYILLKQKITFINKKGNIYIYIYIYIYDITIEEEKKNSNIKLTVVQTIEVVYVQHSQQLHQ